MAGKKKLISVSLPQDLLKKLKAYQQKQVIESSEEAIVAVLQTFFEQADDDTAYAPLDRLIRLEAQVDRLSEQMIDLQKLTVPSVAEMSAQIDRHQTKAIEPSSDYSYEDFEDEPDEILTDFLE